MSASHPSRRAPTSSRPFASEPGDYTQDEIRGELRITAGGKTVTVPIALR
ncbi:MAG: hypothetical protein U0800_17190 [Isosphaeraceae bacterium]